jgi:hypothetical protein
MELVAGVDLTPLLAIHSEMLVATPATNNDGCPSIIISPFCCFGVLAHPVSASISTVLKLQAVA